MTRFESIQPAETFQQAGAAAYRMLILRGSNPYANVRTLRCNPRDEWDKGYMAASEIDVLKERARINAKPKDRKPFKRNSTGPKFTPVATHPKGRRDGN